MHDTFDAVPGIGVITNPRSRANKRDPGKMRRLGYLLGSAGAAEATKSIDDLYRVAEEFKRAKIDVLGINGGDGTIHVTLTAFLQTWGADPFPKVALLGGGTLNTIAKGLGLYARTDRLLYDVIDRYHQGEELETLDRPILQVGDRFGFIFGNGLVANFLDAYYATGKPSPWMGAKLLVRAALSSLVRGKFARKLLQRFHGRVTVDGETWAREDFTTILGGTVPEIGLGFAPFYRCWESSETFPLIGMHCSLAQLTMQLRRIHRSKPLRRDRAISVVAKRALIESDGEWSYTMDGDVYAGPRSLALGPGPILRLIRPPRADL
jgi:diacylglycerol kinase family enzyme